MCADHQPKRSSPRIHEKLGNNITNWNQPLPFHVKVNKLARNMWIKITTGSTCCGHDGEPGC